MNDYYYFCIDIFYIDFSYLKTLIDKIVVIYHRTRVQNYICSCYFNRKLLRLLKLINYFELPKKKLTTLSLLAKL